MTTTVTQEVANLTSSVQALTGAVAVQKSVLDAAVTTAAGSAAGAAVSASAASVAAAAAEAAAASLATVAYQNLTAITKKVLTSANIVAVAMYDTSRDSDGGAWVDRCQHLSWYNETLGTATRGATRKFPRLALITVQRTSVTIHDATDPALPMWMVFTAPGWVGGTAARESTCAAALDAKVVIGRAIDQGFVVVDFALDRMTRHAGLDYMSGTLPVGIADRNVGITNTMVGTATKISIGGISDLAIGVMPFAPPDPVTGLPQAAIAAAITNKPVNVVLPNGAVAANTQAVVEQNDYVSFGNGYLIHGVTNSPNKRLTLIQNLFSPGWATTHTFNASSIPASLLNAATASRLPGRAFGTRFAIGKVGGLEIFAPDLVRQSNGMVAYITKDYATGWLPGDIRLALAEKDTTSLVGVAVADRSGKANDLTVNGTVTRTAVAAGADLTAYGGFGAANYLSRAAAADFDFGAGDFAILLWLTAGAEVDAVIVDRGSAGAAGFRLQLASAGAVVRFVVNDGATTAQVNGTDIRSLPGYRMIAAIRRGARIEMWLAGRLVSSAPAAAVGSLTNVPSSLVIGQAYDGTLPLSAAAKIALPRILAYAPSPEQIAGIYADEAPLFQAGAKCLLGGTSNQVDALAYDPDTGRLLASGPDDTSIFRGLTRVGYVDGAADPNLTSDDHNAVAAARGGYVIASAAEAAANLPALNLREELVRGGVRPRSPVAIAGRTADATPTDILKIPLAEGKTVVVEVTVAAREARDTPSERAGYVRRAVVHRDIGGNVTLVGSVTVTDLYETTAGMDCTLEVDTTAQTVDVNVTGVAGKTLGWTVEVRITEMGGTS